MKQRIQNRQGRKDFIGRRDVYISESKREFAPLLSYVHLRPKELFKKTNPEQNQHTIKGE